MGNNIHQKTMHMLGQSIQSIDKSLCLFKLKPSYLNSFKKLVLNTPARMIRPPKVPSSQIPIPRIQNKPTEFNLSLNFGLEILYRVPQIFLFS